MADKTTNYELTKPLQNEYYDVAVQNDNMDIIDTELKQNADDINAHKADKATLSSYAHAQIGVISVLLDAEDWVGSEAPYTQTVTAEGITAGEVATVDIDLSSIADYQDQLDITAAWGSVHRTVAHNNNEVTVYMNEKPTADIPLTIKVVRG